MCFQNYRKAMELPIGGNAAVQVALLKAASALGHHRATAAVAFCQLRPYGDGRSDWRRAVVTLVRLWRRVNDPAAVLLLGNYEDECRGAGAEIPDPSACSSALAALAAECDAWDLFGLFLIALCYRDGVGCAADPQRGFKAFRALAARGYLPAMAFTGLCFGSGIGVSKNEGEKIKWFRRAADQGYAGAQCYLGFCYRSGTGVAKDDHEAVKWFGLAADQGYASAQYNLGCCYRSGRGVEKDEREAIKWFQLAADQGDADAVSSLRRRGM
jgi:TPR repeat protein